MMSIPKSLQSLLKNRGAIPFVEFMHQALYSPEFGYYTTNFPQIGPSGDFITAPELTPLFGQTLARQCQTILTQLEHPDLFEFGAGSGRLCVDVLTHLEQLDCLPEHYYILEVSGHLRDCQHALIKKHLPHLQNRVHWLTQWPDTPFTGVVLANEILDAMPVHRFLQNHGTISESVITRNAQGQLIEQFNPCTNPQLIAYVQQHIPPEHSPYQSEVNLLLESWLAQCSTMLAAGALFIIDYGFPRSEYYHPDRNQGTLMCHYQHLAHANPLIYLGKQDITAHVDFTHVAEVADNAGFHVASYTNQASFLLASGILNLLETFADETARVAAVQAVKKLIQPHEMGELFKVITLTKHCDWSLPEMMLYDKRASL